jgi:hypothetical protein
VDAFNVVAAIREPRSGDNDRCAAGMDDHGWSRMWADHRPMGRDKHFGRGTARMRRRRMTRPFVVLFLRRSKARQHHRKNCGNGKRA